MSIAQDITRISIQGPKVSIVKMLNAVLRNVGVGNPIDADDTLETINQKIRGERDGSGIRIRIPDMLEEGMLQMPDLQKKKDEFDSDEEGRDSDNFTAPCVDILSVCQSGDEFIVNLELYECEPCYYVDWLWWDDIARLYGCRVFVDDDLYYSGNFFNFCGAIIFEPEGDSIRRTDIRPELNLPEYKSRFDDLISINPERYRPLKIRYFKDKIARMQNELIREEAAIEREKWLFESGKEIDEPIWTDFLLREAEGPEGVKDVYDWYMSRPIYQNSPRFFEALGTVLELRQRKWEGEDESMTCSYDSALSDFNESVATKNAEYDQWEKETEERRRQDNIRMCTHKREEFLRCCAQEDPKSEPVIEWSDDGKENLLGYEYTYYTGATIDGEEHLNEYTAQMDDDHPGRISVCFVHSTRKLEDGYARICHRVSFLADPGHPFCLEGLTRTGFFDLLNSSIPDGVEPLGKDAPLVFDSTDDYARRFAGLGFDVEAITDDEGTEDLPF